MTDIRRIKKTKSSSVAELFLMLIKLKFKFLPHEVFVILATPCRVKHFTELFCATAICAY